MKTVTIPKRFGYPTAEITINGVEQTFNSGEEISVEDAVAEAIENAIALAPVHGRNIGRFAMLVEGSITEVNESDLEGINNVLAYAFYNCDSLTKIAIPNGVNRIGGYTFADCEKLEKVVLPESIASIDGRAFADSHNLTRVTLKAPTPPVLKTSSYIPATCIFEVPAESLAVYKAASEWSNIANQIIAIEE